MSMLATICLTSCVANACAAGGDAPSADPELQGLWVLHSVRDEGGPMGKLKPGTTWFKFANGMLSFWGDDPEHWYGWFTYKADVRPSPRHLDLSGFRDGPWSGIYALRDDELTISARRGEKRPADFIKEYDPTVFHATVKRVRAAPKSQPEWMRPYLVAGVMVAPAWAAITHVRHRDASGAMTTDPNQPFGGSLVLGLRIDNHTGQPLKYVGWGGDGPASKTHFGDPQRLGGNVEARIDRREQLAVIPDRFAEDGPDPLPRTIAPGGHSYDFLTFRRPVKVEGTLILILEGPTATRGRRFVFRIPAAAIELASGVSPDKGAPGKPSFLDRVYFQEELSKEAARLKAREAWEKELAVAAKEGVARIEAQGRAAEAEAVEMHGYLQMAFQGMAEAQKTRRAAEQQRQTELQKQAEVERVARDEAARREAKRKAEWAAAEKVELLEVNHTGLRPMARLRLLPTGELLYRAEGEEFGNGGRKVVNVDLASRRVTIREASGQDRVLTLGGK